MDIIIPNWHPVFVHFTVALVMISALIHVIHLMIDGDLESLKIQTATVANWNLWIGAALTVLTVIAGWFAYNSVAHDTPSHAAMTLHKNWALGTAGYIIAVAIWSYRYSIWAVKLSKPIVFATVFAAVLVSATAWLGGEVVYRYGLGVMSLPKTDAHSHAEGSADHLHSEENESQEIGSISSPELDRLELQRSGKHHDSLGDDTNIERATMPQVPNGKIERSRHDDLDADEPGPDKASLNSTKSEKMQPETTPTKPGTAESNGKAQTKAKDAGSSDDGSANVSPSSDSSSMFQ